MTPRMNRMNQSEERLASALRQLAETSQQGASPELGLFLKDAFRRHHTRRRRVLRLRIAVLCLCVAGLAGSLLLRKPPRKSGEELVVHTIAPQEVMYEEMVSTAKTRQFAPPKRTSTPRQAPTTASGFVALPAFAMLPAGDELRVVRLDMRGEDLRLVGARVTEEIAARRITADFVVGHDGTPYAVRLVRTDFDGQRR